MSRLPNEPGWQRLALDHAHPRRWPGADPGLIEAARRSPLGRRWLATALSAQAPAVFAALPTDTPADALPPVPHDQVLIELGARALAPWWRTQVTRQAVALLRAELGDERYSRLLKHPPAALEYRQDAAAQSGPAGAAALRHQLLDQGASEWRQSLSVFSNAGQQALQLWLPPSHGALDPAPRLTAAGLAQAFHTVVHPHEELAA